MRDATEIIIRPLLTEKSILLQRLNKFTFEVAKNALTAVDDPHDRKAVASELQSMSYTGMSGPLDFTKGPVPGVGIVQPVGVQWKAGTQFPWEMVVVDNSLNPAVPVGGDLAPTNP